MTSQKICCPRCKKDLTNAKHVHALGYCSLECYYHSVHHPDSGLRYNQGKPRVDLIPPEVLLALGEHYRFGAEKYAPNNWMNGLSYSETIGSLLRHLYAFQSGEDIAEENGHPYHHMIAVVWNAVALMYFELHPEKYEKFNDLTAYKEKIK